MSTVRWARDSRRAELEEACLLEEECLSLLDDLEEYECLSLLEEVLEEDLLLCLSDFPDGTSRMFRTRPVVGSVVEDWAGSWETW
jgi:hypothetical protein